MLASEAILSVAVRLWLEAEGWGMVRMRGGGGDVGERERRHLLMLFLHLAMMTIMQPSD